MDFLPKNIKPVDLNIKSIGNFIFVSANDLLNIDLSACTTSNLIQIKINPKFDCIVYSPIRFLNQTELQKRSKKLGSQKRLSSLQKKFYDKRFFTFAFNLFVLWYISYFVHVSALHIKF